MALDDRKAGVLKAVVEEYIETGLPVGSRVIARRYRLGVSPATIRNEMADLEETGYLNKPHMSAGRVPSDMGYRFYVDELMPDLGLSTEECRVVESLFRSRVKDVVSLLKETVRIISDTSNYLGFILGPESDSVTFKSVHLIPTGPDRALLVVVTDIGLVESRSVEVPPMSQEEMQSISDLLSRNLCGYSLGEVAERAYSLLREQSHRFDSIVDQVVEFFRDVASPGEGDRLYIGGAANLLSQPEFKDVEKAKDLLLAVESEGVIQSVVIKEAAGTDPCIRIGKENEVDSVKDLSLVYGTFSAGKTEGRVGILGPKRMNYGKVVALIREVEKSLSRYFSYEE